MSGFYPVVSYSFLPLLNSPARFLIDIVINLIRILFAIALLSPPLALCGLSMMGTHVPSELVVMSIMTSLAACGFWLLFTLRFARVHQHALIILEALDKDREVEAALVEPLRKKPVKGDVLYQSLLEMAERLCERRHQMRDTVDKVSIILTTLAQNRPLDVGTGEFDLPDADDRTLLLGSLCQLITSTQHSKQRGDVFATVLRESPIAMLITDSNLKIRSLNPSAEKLLGFTQQKVLQHSITEFFVPPPPLKSHQKHLKKIVLNGEDALEALRNGRQEVFTTINTGHGKVQLIGLRASFGQHCLFVIRERSKEKLDVDVQGPDTIHFEDARPTMPMEATASLN